MFQVRLDLWGEKSSMCPLGFGVTLAVRMSLCVVKRAERSECYSTRGMSRQCWPWGHRAGGREAS